MLSFLICLILSVGILVFFRMFGKLNIHMLQAILISYIFSALAAIIFGKGDFSWQLISQQNWFPYSLFIGVSFFIGFNIFALSTQKAGLAVTSVAANISVVIPVSIALIFYKESISIYKITGILLALIAILLVFKPEQKSTFKRQALIFPLALFLINGLNNSLMKHAERLHAMQEPMIFLTVVFTMAFLSGLLFIPFAKGKKQVNARSILAGLLLGLLNFGSTYFFLKSLSIFPGSVFFPLFNLSFISAASLIGILFFKEKLSKENWAGIIIAIFAIAIITYFN